MIMIVISLLSLHIVFIFCCCCCRPNFYIGSPLQWVDDVKQRIRAAKRYLKADYKLHVLEESPCADHCIRLALSSSNEAQLKSACDHDHTMPCDRCLDCKKVANDVIAGLEYKDICYK